MKKSLLFLFVIYFSFFTKLFSQSPDWRWTKAATDGGEGWAIKADSKGHEFITGYFNNPTITFGSIVLNNTTIGNDNDIFIAKYDSSGTVLWAKSAGGTDDDFGIEVTTDTSGNVFVTGNFYSDSIRFDTIVLINSSTFSRCDMFIAEYDSSGNVLWAKNAPGDGFDYGLSLASDSKGNIIVTGTFDYPGITFGSFFLPNTGNDDIYTVKYDASGNVVWAEAVTGSNYDDSFGVCTDLNDNIIITGSFQSSPLDFGNISLTNTSNNADIFIAKYDSSGNALWAVNPNGMYYDRSLGICPDASGNIIITGYYSSPTLDFGSNVLTFAGIADAFIAKYDSSGNALWAKSIGGADAETAYNISTDGGNNIYVSGSFTGSTVPLDTTILTAPPANCSISCDPMFIAKYSPGGNLICAGALSSGGDDHNGISSDRCGNAYITSDFLANPFIIGNDTFPLTSGEEDVFISRFDCGMVSGINLPHRSSAQSVILFPNPAQHILTISSTLDDINGISLENVLGIKKKIGLNDFEAKKVEADIRALDRGIYFLRVKIKNELIIKKFIKE